LKLTQRQIAEQIGVDEATIYHWEGQRTVPKLPSTQRIIAFLGYVLFEIPDSIPEKIKNCRKVLGLTQEKMFEVTECSAYSRRTSCVAAVRTKTFSLLLLGSEKKRKKPLLSGLTPLV
jgi:DNA-binding XRE family transcriptional regulator